jgi:hypothetical protein
MEGSRTTKHQNFGVTWQRDVRFWVKFEKLGGNGILDLHRFFGGAGTTLINVELRGTTCKVTFTALYQ